MAAAAGVLLLLGVLLAVLLRLRRRRLDQLTHDLRMARNDLHALCSTSVEVGRRILEIERRLREQTTRIDGLHARLDGLESDERSAPMAGSGGGGYEQAIRLVHRGVDPGDLRDACELTQGEADLISMLHRHEQRGQKTG